MPSRLESQAATDFNRGMPEVKQTVIRRIGGRSDRTEEVDAVVEFDDGAGFVTDSKGQRTEIAGLIEVAADQENTEADTWVIDGKVYRQLGVSTSRDGGSQTIVITSRKPRIAAEPRTRNQ